MLRLTGLFELLASTVVVVSPTVGGSVTLTVMFSVAVAQAGSLVSAVMVAIPERWVVASPPTVLKENISTTSGLLLEMLVTLKGKSRT